jgi:8-oxo-dGTP diphosphatase
MTPVPDESSNAMVQDNLGAFNARLIRVVAAVASRGGNWLICQRPVGKRHGGLWEFPGGKVEPGEDDISSIRRELKEELHVSVRTVGPPLFSVQDMGSLFLIVFRRVEIEGDPQPTEHSAVRWATLDTIRTLPLAPSDRLFIDAADSWICKDKE